MSSSGTPPESRRTRFHRLSDGRRLAYEDLGDPGGLPVFVFHGSPSCRLAPGLYPGEPIPSNVRLIAPDRPGFGQSDPQPGRTLADWPDDVAALADAIHLDRFYLAGGSSGGPAVLACGWKLSDRVVIPGGGHLWVYDHLSEVLQSLVGSDHTMKNG